MTTVNGLQRDDPAPAFALPDADGNIVRLADFAGRSIVLFFYPRADTPGCTTEAQDFSERVAKFEALNTAVVGISADPPPKLAKFRERHGLRVTLVSDESLTTLRGYGVWGEKSMYGKTFEGILRTTFLVSATGKVVEVWRGVKVKDHAEAVLRSVQGRA